MQMYICSSKFLKSCAKARLFFSACLSGFTVADMDGIGFRFVFRVRIACDGFLMDRFKTIQQINKVDCAAFERLFIIIPEIRVFACEARESCLPGRGTRRREPRFPPSYSAQRKSENGEFPEGQERVLQRIPVPRNSSGGHSRHLRILSIAKCYPAGCADLGAPLVIGPHNLFRKGDHRPPLRLHICKW